MPQISTHQPAQQEKYQKHAVELVFANRRLHVSICLPICQYLFSFTNYFYSAAQQR